MTAEKTKQNSRNQKVEGEENKVKNEQKQTANGNVSEAVKIVKAVDFKESNENDVKMAETVMNGLTQQEQIKKEIRELEMKQEQIIKEMDNDVTNRKNELTAKVRMTEVISGTAAGIVAIAGVTTMTVLHTLTGKQIKMEELRLGAQ